MDAKPIKLSRVKVNNENPRNITKDKFQKLINSLLTLPKMLEIRPVVIDDRFVALGGNMRIQALREIAKWNINRIAERLATQPDFVEQDEMSRAKLLDWWENWLANPQVPVLNADHLTQAERKQFLIKDNVSYGTWDYDQLANKWDNNRLEGWGMDVWRHDPVQFPAMTPGAVGTAGGQSAPSATPGHALQPDDPGFEDALPEELQGVDCTPNELEKLKGTDETPTKNVMITYLPEQRGVLAQFLGVDPEALYRKVVWRLDQLEELLAQFLKSEEAPGAEEGASDEE